MLGERTDNHLNASVDVCYGSCGSGKWLHEMAHEFPKSKYHGVDVSSYMVEKLSRHPHPNIDVTLGDVLDRLPFEDDMFDYIHQSSMLLAIPQSKWPGVIAELRRVLKPDGHIDLLEAEIFPPESPTPRSAKFAETIMTILSARDLDAAISIHLEDILEKVSGFKNIERSSAQTPIGWDGEVGNLMRTSIKAGYMAAPEFLCAVLGISVGNWEALLDGVLDDYADGQSTVMWHRTCGQKGTVTNSD
ncbi:S-adenosyl-L-methionine-dependent methyltransferase [Cladochytrium replicatum]|nr:S-adenosyl-L-methionine-dependent methyltransferase [Cladochytrium replicatum]